MILNIVSPGQILYEGEAELVSLPGIQGSFTILERHAPIVSILNKGRLTYRTSEKNISLNIEGGFIEKKNNIITICVE